MSPRRLFALALAAIWLLPIAVAGGVALHVALDHGHRHGPGGIEHAASVPQLLFHGHLHGEDDGAHEHAVAPVVDAGLRPPRGAGAPLPASTVAFAPGPDAPRLAVFEAAPTPPPPRRGGSTRLALISTLRI
jgi:hypothetical protein